MEKKKLPFFSIQTTNGEDLVSVGKLPKRIIPNTRVCLFITWNNPKKIGLKPQKSPFLGQTLPVHIFRGPRFCSHGTFFRVLTGWWEDPPMFSTPPPPRALERCKATKHKRRSRASGIPVTGDFPKKKKNTFMETNVTGRKGPPYV